jgi:preprotein translocase subunit SecB
MATQDNLNHQANGQDEHLPPLTINAQYLKDATFENPQPLKSLQETGDMPEIHVGIDIKLDNLAEKTFEVSLKVSAEAIRLSDKLFIAEVEYAGIFTLGNIPEEAVHPILMIECPRILFPYARQILAHMTREGGFPALSLQPIDFVEMYRQQLEKQQGHREPAPDQS